MNKFLNKIMVITAFVLALLAGSSAAMAQSNDEPIITFKTNIYDTNGAVNQFSLVLGAITEDSEYFDIDFGFGKNEYEVTMAANNESGTFVSGTVSSAGIGKIYGDASKLDYFNASGCYIEWIEFNGCVAMDVLDLSHNELKSLNLGEMPVLRALNLKDNTFSAESPLVLNQKWEQLQVLEIDQINHMDMTTFDMGNYPALISFTAYHNLSLNKVEPAKCPKLVQLSLDVTDVETLDVTQNPELAILNISETRVSSIDVSKNPKLRELYCVHQGSYNYEYKLTSLDVTNNPNLRALHLRTPRLEKIIGLEKLTKLQSFSLDEHNLDEETVLDLRNCKDLHSLDVPLNVKVNISGLNLQFLRVYDATKLISDNLTCKVLENILGHPFPSGAPDGVESLLVYFSQGDGQPSMFSQFADMTDLKDVDMTFYCSGVDYKFTSAQSSIKKLEMMQVDEPQTEIPVPTGWNYLTGVDTLYINKDVNHYDSFWDFTESEPLDLSGMSSLNHAEIKVNKLGGFAVPASMKSLELGTRSSINFTPTGLEYLNLSAGDNPIVIGDAPQLQEVVLYGGATADSDVITLGACPKLEEFRINVKRGKLNFKASSYPALKVFSVQQGKDVKTIPSSSVLPAL